MKQVNRELLQNIQASMVESARAIFEEAEVESLRGLIRLTVEFYEFLQFGNPELRELAERNQHGVPLPMRALELRYSSESTFSGIESFCSVYGTYRILNGATESKIRWDTVSLQSLKGLFVSAFNEFCVETDFVTRCRLLLDLFKMQIVFAGMFYD